MKAMCWEERSGAILSCGYPMMLCEEKKVKSTEILSGLEHFMTPARGHSLRKGAEGGGGGARLSRGLGSSNLVDQ